MTPHRLKATPVIIQRLFLVAHAPLMHFIQFTGQQLGCGYYWFEESPQQSFNAMKRVTLNGHPMDSIKHCETDF